MITTKASKVEMKGDLPQTEACGCSSTQTTVSFLPRLAATELFLKRALKVNRLCGLEAINKKGQNEEKKKKKDVFTID